MAGRVETQISQISQIKTLVDSGIDKRGHGPNCGRSATEFGDLLLPHQVVKEGARIMLRHPPPRVCPQALMKLG